MVLHPRNCIVKKACELYEENITKPTGSQQCLPRPISTEISPYNVEINIGKVLTGKRSVKADKGLKAAKKQKRLHPNTIPTKKINI